MIQRVQSVYLLLVAVLMAITVFSPLLTLVGADAIVHIFPAGVFSTEEYLGATEGILGLAGLSALVALINIFLFKKRKLQIKLGILTSFLIVLFYVALFGYIYVYSNKNGLELTGIKYGIVLPLVALILNLLAIYKIKSDEKLIRSLDRIR